MKILPHEKLEITVLEDPKTAGVKFKINNATTTLKKARALVIQPKKAKLISLIAGRNFDSIPHTVRVRLYDKDGKVSLETTETLQPRTSLQYTPETGFYVLDDRHDTIKPVHYQDGEDGEDGERGIQGDKGDRGERGQTGPEGAEGAPGAQGEAGEVGREGSVGTEGPRGLRGFKGTPIKWRGEWNKGTNYMPLDAVSYKGSSYINTEQIKGKLPTTKDFWNLLAAKGVAGKKGPKGEAGKKGGGGGRGNGVAAEISTNLIHTVVSGQTLLIGSLEFYPLPRRFTVEAGGIVKVEAGGVLLGRP